MPTNSSQQVRNKRRLSKFADARKGVSRLERQATLTVSFPPLQSASHRFSRFLSQRLLALNAMRHAPALRLAASLGVEINAPKVSVSYCHSALTPSCVSFRAQPSRRMSLVSLSIVFLSLLFCFLFLGPICNETFTATAQNKRECMHVRRTPSLHNPHGWTLSGRTRILPLQVIFRWWSSFVFSHWPRCEAFLLSLPQTRLDIGRAARLTEQYNLWKAQAAAPHHYLVHPCVYCRA